MNRIIISTAAVTIIAGVGAIAQEGIPDNTPLPEVRAIWLQTNGCSSELQAELQGIGLTLTDTRGAADATMSAEMRRVDVGIGAAAQYTAVLRDQLGKELLSATGTEDAMNEAELCSNIGEAIAERIEARRAAAP